MGMEGNHPRRQTFLGAYFLDKDLMSSMQAIEYPNTESYRICEDLLGF